MINFFVTLLCLQIAPSEVAVCHNSLKAMAEIHKIYKVERALTQHLEQKIDPNLKLIGVTIYSIGVDKRFSLTFPLGSVNFGVEARDNGGSFELGISF